MTRLLAAPAALTVLIAAIYALKNPTAFVVVVAVTIWLVSVAVALIVSALYGETKQQLADTERKAEVLTDALMAADQENAILSGRLADVAPVPLIPFDSVPKPERDHITSAPRLHVVADEHARADDDFFGRLYGRDDEGNLL